MRRLYRALLALYPSRFRDEYREEMCRAFAARTRGRSRPAMVVAAIADVVPNAVAAHWDILRHGAAAGTTLPAFGSDVRFALRQIARAPLLSGVIIGVIALGIGINAGLLTLLNTYAWQPAPGIPRDASLARLTPVATRVSSGGVVDVSLSYREILALRDRRDAFTEVAAWAPTNLAADLGSGSEPVLAWYTTANFFRMLRVNLAAGPGFPADLDQSNAPVAVITHSLWMTNFGGSPDVIGKTIRVLNQSFTIVGVAPPRFTGVDVLNMGRSAIWLPIGARAMLEPNATDPRRSRGENFRGVARLARGVTPADVSRLTAPLAVRLAEQNPESRAHLSIRAERLTGIASRRSDKKELVAAFLLVATLIVVITCTNVSALLLGRAAARRREIGVRLALGATRLRLIRQMLTESLVHALAGALLGLALYIPVVKIAYAMAPELVYGLEAETSTFLFATLFAFATTIVFGLAPALHATSADIGEVMKNSGNHAIRRSRLQMIFVIVQLACSQPVLVVTSLVLADIRRGANLNADRAPESVVTMSSTLYRPSRDSASTVGSGSLRAIRARVATIPGVRSVAVTSENAEREPIVRLGGGESFAAAGGKSGDIDTPIKQLYISADYFATYGMPLMRGRAIDARDDHRGSSAVVVNQAAADLLWPGDDPVGARLVRRAASGAGSAVSLDVIGVVGSPPYDKEDGGPAVYVPLATASSDWLGKIAVRTSGDARAYVPAIRAAIRDVEPDAAIDEVITLAERYASQRREALQSNAAAFAVGTAALLLASLGLYAIIAFAVAQRTREIGIRLAMGATAGRVIRHFFRDGLIVSAIGLAIGLPVTVIGIRVVKASVLGLTLENVAAVILVVPVLVGVAALASWLPARRAGRVDPVIALRSE